MRFVLYEEPAGEGFQFAPLATGDTIMVLTADDECLTRSDAILYVLGWLGGLWRLTAALGRLVPRPLRDALYSGFARIRLIFGRPDQACPILPSSLRARVH